MANTIAYATLFQNELDKQIVQLATSGWMEDNAGQVIYNGGSEIKIPKLALDGLKDYNRATGYAAGAVDFSYQTKEMTQDRGTSFHLDAMDVNETNFVLNASTVMSEFQRTKVVPEIDAYRYSTIAAAAVAASRSETYTLAEATIVAKLYSHIFKLADAGVDMANMVITMSYPAYQTLTTNSSIQKKLDVGQFTKGNVTTEIKFLEGIPLIPVSSDRMKTAFVFNDGTTSGQTAGGFVPASGAKDVNWIVTARTTPIAVSKTDVPRIFDPMTNQAANAWKIDYRKYHDLFIPDNQLAKAVFVAVGA
ncbi:hypothetical protein [Paenibacillus sp. FSL H3-0333]|uniref:hypothetical protein n=1 Tax=Paenibacillus sp. FSL H3-0333 TaxID=2921373 RepID=UPI0030FB43EC